ncbi:MAG TPA: SufD family Fe-S cluster assembly protein [Enorma massiliensis]|uniref:SufB/SufD family protein n=1 Tax=Enorma massiliensis TaxID=1472761 RepID=UPI001D6930C3|nr:SufD family Fe-S cluster assembly protein [Enorma massiliensis]HJG62432.1 SufD family Fe-S cluster assembly protein [Enorma massiliensis]
MDSLTIKHANAMPAPTWGWLRMNDTQIEIPMSLAPGGSMEVDAEDRLFDHAMSFEGAVAELQARLDAARATANEGSAGDDRACVRAALAENAARNVAADGAAEMPGTAETAESVSASTPTSNLELPALSRYQKRASLEEAALDVATAFETGIGADTRAYLNFLARETMVLAAAKGAREQATIRVEAEAGEAAAASIDVVAAPGSTFDLVIALDATAAMGADDAAAALAGTTLRVFAGSHARVNVTVYALGTPAAKLLDDEGYVLDEGARVNVRHVVLGGELTVTGLAADVRGDTARLDIDTRYLASGSEQRDFNYIVRQRGRKTVSNMNANGVLTGTSKKVLRGTIDLVHGCKGSEGSEQETVLLASEGVDNKTVPTILCDEDDVAGNHGATIGHVRPEQLFYLESRGVSAEAAEALFIRAKLEDAALSAPDERIRASVLRLGEALIPGFTDDIDAPKEDAA